MSKYRDLNSGDPFPASWTDAIQEYISTGAFNLKIEQVNATTIRVPAGTDNDQATIGISGRWRYNTANVTAAHPGGAAGNYDVWVTASDNSFTGSGTGEVDATNYAFALVIKPTTYTWGGGDPPLRRKIGYVTWSGTAITDVRETVGAQALIKHGPTHDPVGSDPLDWTTAMKAVRLRGTRAARPAASAANAGFFYFATDEGIIYFNFENPPSTYAWEVWGGSGWGKYTTLVGDGSSVSFTVTHNLGTSDVIVVVREAASPFKIVDPEVRIASANSVTLRFAAAPSASQYFVAVLGGVAVSNTVAARGTLSVAAGSATATAPHGLTGTPGFVSLTPTSDTQGKRWWLSTRDGTNVGVTLDSNAAVSPVTFDWEARL